MLISASIASSDILNVSEEIKFADKCFSHLHLDIEDGIAVPNISFGFKMCRKVCEMSTSHISIHLEVSDPLMWIDEIEKCHPDIVFIQTDHLDNPGNILDRYIERGIPVGISLSSRDIGRDVTTLLNKVDEVLVITARLDDPLQKYSHELESMALEIVRSSEKKVWLDGAINYEIIERLINDKKGVYAVVIGRAAFSDKTETRDRIRFLNSL